MAKKKVTNGSWMMDPKDRLPTNQSFLTHKKGQGHPKKKFEQGWKNFHWQGNKDNPSWEPELSQWSSTTEKKMQEKTRDDKRVFLSATFRPSNASLPVLDTSKNIDIESDHG